MCVSLVHGKNEGKKLWTDENIYSVIVLFVDLVIKSICQKMAL